MNFIDTHTHLFLDHFNGDLDKTIQTAIEKGINKFILPNIDSSTIDDIFRLVNKYPDNCLPVMGLHPTSVDENYKKELDIVTKWLKNEKFYAIGETGIDLYWDKTFLKEQIEAFEFQLQLAKEMNLPIIIHVRDSFDEVFEVVDRFNDDKLKGVFHCFSGNSEQAEKIVSYGGFKLGIGGVVTFKNSNLGEVISKLSLENLVLETDSPYLAPVPFRGKRNESSYITYVAQKIAEVSGVSIEEVAKVTTKNAQELFGI